MSEIENYSTFRDVLNDLGVTVKEYNNDILVHDVVNQMMYGMQSKDLIKQLLQMVIMQKEEILNVKSQITHPRPMVIQCSGGDNCPVRHMAQKNPHEGGSDGVDIGG